LLCNASLFADIDPSALDISSILFLASTSDEKAVIYKNVSGLITASLGTISGFFTFAN
jgi:hypothetical protein